MGIIVNAGTIHIRYLVRTLPFSWLESRTVTAELSGIRTPPTIKEALADSISRHDRIGIEPNA